MINILFVCMGNICRSPTAEGFMARQMEKSAYKDQLSIDSAGTHSYHIGHAPDSRSIEAAESCGIQLGHLRARKVSNADFFDFDLIIAMDRSNLANLQAITPPDSKATLQLMLAFHPEEEPNTRTGGGADEVPDPYYGDFDGFNYMCGLLDAATQGLLKRLEERLQQVSPNISPRRTSK